MSARTTIEHALRVYYADSPNVQRIVDGLLAKDDAERRAEVLGEAADVADGAVHVYNERGDTDRASAAFALSVKYRRMATEASEKSSRAAADATHEPAQAGGDQ